MAICNFAIDVKSSVLLAAETPVSGVLAVLSVTDGVGVDPDVVPPDCFAACFAAFSANRFCLEVDGAMTDEFKMMLCSNLHHGVIM